MAKLAMMILVLLALMAVSSAGRLPPGSKVTLHNSYNYSNGYNSSLFSPYQHCRDQMSKTIFGYFTHFDWNKCMNNIVKNFQGFNKCQKMNIFIHIINDKKHRLGEDSKFPRRIEYTEKFIVQTVQLWHGGFGTINIGSSVWFRAYCFHDAAYFTADSGWHGFPEYWGFTGKIMPNSDHASVIFEQY